MFKREDDWLGGESEFWLGELWSILRGDWIDWASWSVIVKILSRMTEIDSCDFVKKKLYRARFCVFNEYIFYLLYFNFN
jgi:hypothetical protein